MPDPSPALAALALGVHGALGVFVLLGLASGAVWLAFRAYRDTEPSLDSGPRVLLTGLRALVLLLLLAMLAEPVWHRERTVVADPSVLLLVDDSASMQIRGAEGLTRAERARQLRERLADSFEARAERPRVFLAEGSRRLESSTEIGVDAPETDVSEDGDDGDGTDLAGLVLSAGQRHLEDNLAAIVLLSDGRSTTTRAPSLAGFDVPVFAVAVGDTAGPLDLRLDRVRYPAYVHRGDRVVIDAELVVDAAEAGSTWARLRDEDGAVSDSTRLRWPEGGGRVPLQFVVDADSLGVRQYELSVRDGGAEAVLRNNAVRIGFEVGKDRLQVFYLESNPSWNAHFLARLASRDRRLQWNGVYRADDGFRLAGTDSVLNWPPDEDFQRDVDLWIAGSLQDLQLLTSPGLEVERHVRAGAGLLVLAGDGGIPGRVGTEALELIPLRPQPRSRWIPGEIRAAVTPAGRGHPVLAVGSEEGDLEDLLGEVPPLRAALLPLDVAPDADVLLQGRGARSVVPLLAVREEGEGTVAAWTGAPLWSWSFWRLGDNDAEPVYRALIGNLVATLAEGGDRERLRLQLPGPVVAQGEDAVARAVLLDVRMRPEEAQDVWLEWARAEDVADTSGGATREDAVLGRVLMRTDPRTPGGRRTAVPALPPGEYRVRVSSEGRGERLVSDWQPLTVDPYSVEFRNPGVDRASLASLANRTGGRLLRAERLDDWTGSVGLEEERRVLEGRLDLWASPWLLLPLLGALALEWILRKRWGLI